MNNKISKYRDEIDLFDFLKLVWKGKKIIALVIIFSLMIGISYIYMNSLKPTTYEISMDLSPNEKSDFVNFTNINKILISNDFKDHLITNKIIFKKFINNITNFENIMTVLKDSSFIKEKIVKLPETEKKKVLNSYAKLLTVEKINIESSQLVLKLKWHNIDEALQILDQMLNFSLLNLKDDIFKNLDNIQEVMRRYDIEKDKKRIVFLENQSLIAQELNIVENEVNLSTTLDKDARDKKEEKERKSLEYERGVKAIDKEISIIKNRKYRDQIFLSNEIIILKNLDKINWVKFELLTAKIVTLNKINYFKILAVSTFLGLISGVILVNVINLSKSLRKQKY